MKITDIEELPMVLASKAKQNHTHTVQDIAEMAAVIQRLTELIVENKTIIQQLCHERYPVFDLSIDHQTEYELHYKIQIYTTNGYYMRTCEFVVELQNNDTNEILALNRHSFTDGVLIINHFIEMREILKGSFCLKLSIQDQNNPLLNLDPIKIGITF